MKVIQLFTSFFVNCDFLNSYVGREWIKTMYFYSFWEALLHAFFLISVTVNDLLPMFISKYNTTE